MLKKLVTILLLTVIVVIAGIFVKQNKKPGNLSSVSSVVSAPVIITPTPDPAAPLYISTLKKRTYPASTVEIKETLKPGANYRSYIASYLSDGLKIYGLFTVPDSPKPTHGFPVIVFLHGYLDPKTYQTTARYVAYQDSFARNGFITFKPDLRGHGNSEGNPVNSNFSQDYVIDTLNLISALKIYKDADPGLIGLWGHSNGGGIALRTMEVSQDIRAAVIWAGVVGSYQDLLVSYRAKIPWIANRSLDSANPMNFVEKYDEPDLASPFWSQIDPYSFIRDISAPVQLHHGTSDSSVPIEISRHFRDVLQSAGKSVELYEYPGGDHNLAAPAFSTAMARSVAFFKKYLGAPSD